MINWAGWAFGTNGGHNQLDRTLAVKVSGADHELRHVGAFGVGEKAGIWRGGVLQYRIAGIGFGREGPVKAQWLFRRRIRIEVAKVGGLTDPDGDDGPRPCDYVNSSGCGCRLFLGKLTIAWASSAPGNQHSEQNSAQASSQCTRRLLYELGRHHDLKLLIYVNISNG